MALAGIGGAPGFEPLTSQLKARLEELRREAGIPANTSRPERPEPWRPNPS